MRIIVKGVEKRKFNVDGVVSITSWKKRISTTSRVLINALSVTFAKKISKIKLSKTTGSNACSKKCWF